MARSTSPALVVAVGGPCTVDSAQARNGYPSRVRVPLQLT
jgi:hypothetical protein